MTHERFTDNIRNAIDFYFVFGLVRNQALERASEARQLELEHLKARLSALEACQSPETAPSTSKQHTIPDAADTKPPTVDLTKVEQPATTAVLVHPSSRQRSGILMSSVCPSSGTYTCSLEGASK